MYFHYTKPLSTPKHHHNTPITSHNIPTTSPQHHHIWADICQFNVKSALWGCYGDVMEMLWGCYGDVVVMLWWCYEDGMGILWGYFLGCHVLATPKIICLCFQSKIFNTSFFLFERRVLKCLKILYVLFYKRKKSICLLDNHFLFLLSSRI